MNFNDLLNWLTTSGFHPLFGAEIIIAVGLTIRMLQKNIRFLYLSVVYIDLLTSVSLALGVYSCSHSAHWAIIAFLIPFKSSLLVAVVIYLAFEYYLIGTLSFYSGLVVGLMIFSSFIIIFLQMKHPIIPFLIKIITGSQETYFFVIFIYVSDANFLLRLFAFFAWSLRAVFWDAFGAVFWKTSFHPFAIFRVLIFPAAAWLVHSNDLVYYVQLFVSLELIVFFLGSDWQARIVADASVHDI